MQIVERKRIDEAFPTPTDSRTTTHIVELCINVDADCSSAAIYTGVLVFRFNFVWDVFMLDCLIHTGLAGKVGSGKERA